MKNKQLISILILLFLVNFNAFGNNTIKQCYGLDTPRLVHFNHDTMQYLISDFNDSVSLYTNQPLNKLLKKLEIAPKFFVGTGSLREKDSVRLVNIYFIDWDRYGELGANHKPGNFYRLDIFFEKPFANDDFELVQRKSNLLWSRTVRNYLGSRTIKSFKFYKR